MTLVRISPVLRLAASEPVRLFTIRHGKKGRLMNQPLKTCLHLYIFLLLVTTASFGQAEATTSVMGARPVRDVILQWEEQYGWVIPYEDPRFVYSGDLEDVTEKVRRDLKPGEAIDPEKRIVVSRERQLSVSYKAPTKPTDQTAMFEAVKQLANAYSKAAGTTFIVSQSESRVRIAPGLVRDTEGHLQPSQPVLDTVISIPAKERNGVEFLHALCDTLATATGFNVFVGTTPVNSLVGFRTQVEYRNVPAWRALEDFLDQMPGGGKRYTWALLYQKDYALNIHWVNDPNQASQVRNKRSTPHQQRVDEIHSEGKTIYIAR